MPTEQNNQPGAVPPGQPADGKPSVPEAAEGDQQQSVGWKAAEKFKAEAEQLKKEVDALKGQQAKREADEAIARGEFEKLYREEKTKREEADRVAKRATFLSEAQKHGGLIDPDVAKVFDLDSITIDALPEFVANAAKSKPALFAKPNGKNGQPFQTPQANPGARDGRTTFDPSRAPTSDQISAMSPEQFQEWAKAKDAMRSDPLRR